MPRHSQTKAVAIDLFAGLGGLSLGLGRSGFLIGAALDNDPIAVKSYRSNVGDHIVCAPVEEVSASELMRNAGVRPGECDLLTGGPPCQGFSLQRRGPREDARNRLVLQFVRMIEEVKPKFFLMENVGALLNRHGEPFLAELRRTAARLDYGISVELLDAADFGVPQRRRRAFLIGERVRPGATSRFRFPSGPTAGRPKTVRDAIADLPSPPEDGSCHPLVSNHFRERRLSATNIERIKHVPPGGGREDLPAWLQLDCHKNNQTHRHLDVYGRLHWDEPAVTLTARFDSFTRGRFAHPVEHRSLTIREGARIQTFPDSFEVFGNREEQARQVGNAVPPKMASALGSAILAAMGLSAERAA